MDLGDQDPTRDTESRVWQVAKDLVKTLRQQYPLGSEPLRHLYIEGGAPSLAAVDSSDRQAQANNMRWVRRVAKRYNMYAVKQGLFGEKNNSTSWFQACCSYLTSVTSGCKLN